MLLGGVQELLVVRMRPLRIADAKGEIQVEDSIVRTV
jgi:hypothetical protein